MNASVTARELARAKLSQAIKDAARNQLATAGAGHLSLRAVSREIGMVSSAVYRYFPTRDDLLTALIVDAYDALGAAVETAGQTAPERDIRARWRAMCAAVRGWARKHPHEYGLIYGSPIPDYQAPPDTVAPGARVPIALLTLVRDGWRDGVIVAPPGPTPNRQQLESQLAATAAAVAPGLPSGLVLRAGIAWTQLFGMITFELFGQFVGSVEPADEFFAETVELMAGFVGIA